MVIFHYYVSSPEGKWIGFRMLKWPAGPRKTFPKVVSNTVGHLLGPGVVPLDCGTHMRGAKGVQQQHFFSAKTAQEMTWKPGSPGKFQSPITDPCVLLEKWCAMDPINIPQSCLHIYVYIPYMDPMGHDSLFVSCYRHLGNLILAAWSLRRPENPSKIWSSMLAPNGSLKVSQRLRIRCQYYDILNHIRWIIFIYIYIYLIWYNFWKSLGKRYSLSNSEAQYDIVSASTCAGAVAGERFWTHMKAKQRSAGLFPR